MKNTIFYFLVITLFAGCIIDPVNVISQYIYNSTTHNIKIIIKNRSLIDSMIISSGEKKLIESGLGLPTTLTGDSVIVVFDDTYRTIHLCTDSIININKNVYSFSHVRNITNLNNYKKEEIKRKKKSYDQIYTFTFTEQDYIDAQKKSRLNDLRK